ncbi:neutral zinc metallopeptidase [Corynebacterium sp. 153RC1]|uniref:KPN_02809 family neutral zinc metallopeptidase n=1 Tax=Corynebacterium TaxID=1716 RepID=UPI00211C8DD1|nr:MULTISPECIES: neutral zinc metallopeptidase [unclassified Corynebacterium]MCQ9369670.1 neutral zinc metallopeptidase [Corynebacterium sp. 35RC1]MCQ9342763.1 neutral zinc metallopeptidase [Corynebacterium sp. 76QC2CO]MCQ9351482.1 neutral zinc metallopeptidase [Corynebacterium sp. 209RC1]MCQ9354611.1 neutral zinc metallopeptidase [Corynebacterium sp. 1222RC1]MCQ9357332.1 neutral zinc metallopeptidase [Corynebacterium sp. 122RC1]
MTFRGGIQKTESRARTGGGGTGRMVAGGGIGTVLLVGLFLLMGGNPAQLDEFLGSQSGAGQQQVETSGGLDHCQVSDQANTEADCRVEFTALSVDQMWQEILPQQAGIEYTEPGLVVFTNATQSGCGYASSKTGPFYCPADQSTYFDVSFFDQLSQYGGENTPFAQQYIVAHEFGHHIQQLEGTLRLSNYNDPGAESNAVLIELQADCYAGMWAHYADQGEDAFLEPITDAQVNDAITAARAVGDDNIQQRSTGEVRPDLFTHGTSEQRQEAFLTGYRTGQMSSCDTLGRGVYRDS